MIPGLIGVVLVLGSLAVLAWGVWPVTPASRQAALRIPTSAAQEVYQVDLTWPEWLRQGDSGVIRLVVELGDNPPETGLLVESRLESAGLLAIPGGEILEPLRPGRQAVFYWKVLSKQSGDQEATIWVNLSPQPAQGDPAPSQLLTAQKIPIRTYHLLGLSGLVARWLGGIGIVFGLALCLDGFLLPNLRQEGGS